MKFSNIILCFNLTLFFALSAGCSNTEPYIFDLSEFDRNSDEYLNGINDRKRVTICTANLKNNYELETLLAKHECSLFGKIAKFSSYSYSECPLATIKAVNFDCK